MNTIECNATSVLEIKKSKFIAVLKKVNSESDAKKELINIKIEYPNAKHYTYAYIIDNVKKASDDKEPSGTAGGPILNILELNDLNHVICIVVRYFGGILLGAPGLVRAYSKSASMALSNTNIIPLISYLEVEINFSYELSKRIEYLLKDITIINKDFKSDITYSFLIPDGDLELVAKLKKMCNLVKIKEKN